MSQHHVLLIASNDQDFTALKDAVTAENAVYTRLVASSASLGLIPYEKDAFDTVAYHGTDKQYLKEIYRVLKNGGEVKLTSAQLKDDLLFAGFLDASAETSGAFAVRASKPSFQVGTAFSLQTKQQTSIAQQTSGNGSAVKVSLDEDGDDAMVDDSDLLEDEDLAAPSQEFDCGPGNGAARKACKNCSCGLAKKQQSDAAKSAVAAARSAATDGAAVKIDLDAIEVPTSSCGNCYLGDAFRCATCPFLGKPAFKKGEEKKVLLDLTDD